MNSLTGSEKFSDVQAAAEKNEVPKCRVCLDIKYPNEAMADWPLRYEDVDAVTTILQPNDYFIKQDLSNFYLRLPTHRLFNPYQSFRDPFSKDLKMYVRLSFGVKVGSTFASGVSAEANLIIRARFIKLGIQTRFKIYIDDYFGRCQSPADAAYALHVSEEILNEKLGLPTSKDKKVTPTQTCEMLGVLLDSVACTSSVKPKHREHAMKEIETILAAKDVKARRLHRLCGLLNFSVPLVFGSRPFLRPLWALLKLKKRNPHAKITDNQYSKLRWWFTLLNSGLPAPNTPWVNPAVAKVTSIATDASGTIGCGVWAGQRRYFHRWNSSQLSLSIGAKELYAVTKYVEKFETNLADSTVIAFTDNIGNVYSINAGTTKSKDESLMLEDLALIQRRSRIRVLASWLPREYNPIPDMISKSEISGEPF